MELSKLKLLKNNIFHIYGEALTGMVVVNFGMEDDITEVIIRASVLQSCVVLCCVVTECCVNRYMCSLHCH